MTAVNLRLLVLRCADLERAVGFYRTLGLAFTKEKHGSGPEHYASSMSTAVLELYPASGEAGASASVRVGFQVPSVNDAIASLEASGIAVIQKPTDSEWGRRAVVCDPDGRRVEITEES